MNPADYAFGKKGMTGRSVHIIDLRSGHALCGTGKFAYAVKNRRLRHVNCKWCKKTDVYRELQRGGQQNA